MKLEDFFTPEELALIDSGEYRPGRAMLDAKLDLCAAIEREACAMVCDDLAFDWHKNAASGPGGAYNACATAIRARGQA